MWARPPITAVSRHCPPFVEQELATVEVRVALPASHLCLFSFRGGHRCPGLQDDGPLVQHPPQTPCMCPGEAGVGGRASVTLLRLAVWGYLCLPPAMGPRQDADAPRGWGWGSLPIITPELHGTGDCVARPVLLSGPVGPGPWQNACLPQTAPSAFLLGVGGPFLPRQPGPGPALHTPE